MQEGKQKQLGRKVILFLGAGAFLAVAIYLSVQMYEIVNHTYKTQTAIYYTMADSLEVNGIVAFEEQNIEGHGTIGYLVADGERVAKDTQVAEVYTSDRQAVYRDQLTSLAAQITLLEKSQNAGGSDLNVLFSQQQTALYHFLDTIDSGSLGNVQSSEQDYLLSANRLQICTGAKTDFSDAIASLQTQYDAILTSLGTPEGIYSPINGYFVSSDSARYLSVDKAALDAADPIRLQQLIATDLSQGSAGSTGKVVTSYKWYFYCVVPLDQMHRFTDSNALSIHFPGKAETVLPAMVESVTEDETANLAKVCIGCEYTDSAILALGQEEAEIIFSTCEGIRIDRSAVHVVNGNKGVYVKYGNIARFLKITPYDGYETEDYVLVPENGKIGTENEVRLYDEIIVEGTNLADGKLL